MNLLASPREISFKRTVLSPLLFAVSLIFPITALSDNGIPIVNIESSSQERAESPGLSGRAGKYTYAFFSPPVSLNIRKGEWIKYYFPAKNKLKSMTVFNASIAKASFWKGYNRIKSATLFFSDGSIQDLVFPDVREPVNFDLKYKNTHWVKLRIKEIYSGQFENQRPSTLEVYFYHGRY